MQVFEGFTVVELADRRNQFIGKLMAESGARVIQIEPMEGAPGRWIGPFVDDKPDPDQCLDYWWYNTDKQSVCIDITRKPGQDLIRGLIAQADVFIESTRPGTLQGYGLDYEAVTASHPELIYLSFTDFGQDGPWVDFEMNDHAHLALGGPMGSSGYSDPHETPIGGQRNHAYNMSSVMATHTITGALFERLSSDLGQYIDLAIHDVVGISTEAAVPYWLWYNQAALRQTGQHAAVKYRPTTQILCSDGKLVQVTMPQLPLNAWVQLVKWMEEVGVAGELSDEKWRDDFYRADRLRNGDEIHEGIIRLLSKVTSEEAFNRGQALGMAWAVIRAAEENMDLEHYKQRDYWQPIEQPEIGRTILYPRALHTNDLLGTRPKHRAPHVGEHTATILKNDLGVDDARIEALTKTGVVR